MTKNEYDSILRTMELLVPIMQKYRDERIGEDFHALLSYLAKEGEDRRHNPLRAAEARWKDHCNAVKFRGVIRIAKTKMALGADREEILDAVMSEVGNGVKGQSRKNLTRILLKNKALPRARQKQ